MRHFKMLYTCTDTHNDAQQQQKSARRHGHLCLCTSRLQLPRTTGYHS